MLARRQDGRRVLVLLLAAAGCCLARPQFEPGSTGSAKWERSSSPSTSPPATGSTIQAPDSSASLSGQPYSDKFHHRYNNNGGDVTLPRTYHSNHNTRDISRAVIERVEPKDEVVDRKTDFPRPGREHTGQRKVHEVSLGVKLMRKTHTDKSVSPRSSGHARAIIEPVQIKRIQNFPGSELSGKDVDLRSRVFVQGPNKTLPTVREKDRADVRHAPKVQSDKIRRYSTAHIDSVRKHSIRKEGIIVKEQRKQYKINNHSSKPIFPGSEIIFEDGLPGEAIPTEIDLKLFSLENYTVPVPWKDTSSKSFFATSKQTKRSTNTVTFTGRFTPTFPTYYEISTTAVSFPSEETLENKNTAIHSKEIKGSTHVSVNPTVANISNDAAVTFTLGDKTNNHTTTPLHVTTVSDASAVENINSEDIQTSFDNYTSKINKNTLLSVLTSKTKMKHLRINPERNNFGPILQSSKISKSSSEVAEDRNKPQLPKNYISRNTTINIFSSAASPRGSLKTEQSIKEALPTVDSKVSLSKDSFNANTRNSTLNKEIYFQKLNKEDMLMSQRINKSSILKKKNFARDPNEVNGTYMNKVFQKMELFDLASHLNSTDFNLSTSQSRMFEDEHLWLPIQLKPNENLNIKDESDAFPNSSSVNTSEISSASQSDDKLKKSKNFTRRNDDFVEDSQLIAVHKLPEKSHSETDLVAQFVANNLHDLKTPVQDFPMSKMDDTKNWPNGENGVESLDDLILYHTYTNTPIKQHTPTVSLHHSYNGGVTGVIKRPAVTIQQMHNWDYTQSRPKPKPPPPPLDHTNFMYNDLSVTRPNKPAIIIIDNPPPISNSYGNPVYGSTNKPQHSQQNYPSYSDIFNYVPAPQSKPTYSPVPIVTARPTASYGPPYYGETGHPQDLNPYYDKCPNVVIGGQTSLANFKNYSKEGCADINIVIHSDIVNQNHVDVDHNVPPSSDDYDYPSYIQNQEPEETTTPETELVTTPTTTTTTTTTTSPATTTDTAVTTTTASPTPTSAIKELLHSLLTPAAIWLFLFAPLLAGLLLAGAFVLHWFWSTAGWRNYQPSAPQQPQGWGEYDYDWDRDAGRTVGGSRDALQPVRRLAALEGILTSFEKKVHDKKE